MIKINNEKDLLSILKIISEESVKKAKRSLNENTDAAQENYLKMMQREESFYGVDLNEKDKKEKSEVDEEDEADVKGEEEVEDDELGEDELDPEVFGVSFDSVLKDINTLRAGRSTKDKEIKEELLTYYDRLDEDERKILHLFLRELSKILQGALDGEDAIDPSDAPLYADIIMQGGDEGEEEAKPARKKRRRQVSTGPVSDEIEDTSPPIKVNEHQDLNEIRRRVKNLMKRF
tara:strand:- start:4105 stop:4803 length:699 start_codon:yes stop_codon:yes gene_type:complete